MEFTGLDPKNVTFGFAVDLSSRGAFVQTAFPAASGSRVVVRFWRPGWAEELHVRGVVRWACSAGMGVEFAAVGWGEERLINELLGESLPVANPLRAAGVR